MKLAAAMLLTLALGRHARAAEFLFETSSARVALSSNGTTISFADKLTGKQRLAGEAAFAMVRKAGQEWPASAIERRGDTLHVVFGQSGVQADYRVISRPHYLVIELAHTVGESIDEIVLAQFRLKMARTGTALGVQWDNDFAVCLMGLSERVQSAVSGDTTRASVHSEFGMIGEKIAVIAEPMNTFLDVVREVERDFQLPAATISGEWAKASPDIHASYLFTDLTEANADATIRYAKLAGFRYILVYAFIWSESLGSYPINPKSYPGGEAGLKKVIDKCHRAGLKAGMHMLTSAVSKNDPLVRPKPDTRLLKDGEATLVNAVTADATAMEGTAPVADFPLDSGYSNERGGRDIVIDAEIIHYGQIEGTKLVGCVRGFAGTTRAAHQAGAKIQHLAQRFGTYLADLRTPLKDAIADRIAGLINRCGFDMIYFDGGEADTANGPFWYWVGREQSAIRQRSKRDLLIQGSAMTQWTWHFFARGACDDYSAVAVKPYLDLHKIADFWVYYRDNFLPAELGWWGFLPEALDGHATTPDEVEHYAVRMLALDSPVSLETGLLKLKANGRTEEMLKLLGRYERFRMAGATKQAMRHRLLSGEWHMTESGEFLPVRYDVRPASVPGTTSVQNTFAQQTLKFRIQVAAELSQTGDPANQILWRADQPMELRPPDSKAVLPGALIRRIDLPRQPGEDSSATEVSSSRAGGVNLVGGRALAVRLEVEGTAAEDHDQPVLTVQLESILGNAADPVRMYRDYHIDINFSGSRTVILEEPSSERTIGELRPAYQNYLFKSAVQHFDYSHVTAVNLRWARYGKGSGARIGIISIEALQERPAAIRDFRLSAAGSSIRIPGWLKTGDYAEFRGNGVIRIFNAEGQLLRTARHIKAPLLNAGPNSVDFDAQGSARVILTTITLGK